MVHSGHRSFGLSRRPKRNPPNRSMSSILSPFAKGEVGAKARTVTRGGSARGIQVQNIAEGAGRARVADEVIAGEGRKSGRAWGTEGWIVRIGVECRRSARSTGS